MSASEEPLDPKQVWRRLYALVKTDTDLVDTIDDALKTFRELGVEATWYRFERRLLKRLEGCSRKHVENAEVLQELASEIEWLRTSLVMNVYQNRLPAKQSADDLSVCLPVKCLCSCVVPTRIAMFADILKRNRAKL